MQLERGDRVALLVPGSERYLGAVISLLVRGIVPIPLDPRLSEHERTRVLADLDPALVVTDTEDLERLDRGWEPGDVPLARPMHVTSGTTGSPKGVWSGLLPRDRAEALLAEERDLWGFCADDVNLAISPLYHSAPLRFAIGTSLAGGRVEIAPFDPQRVTDAIARHRPTTMFCVPTHLQRLFAHWDGAGTPDLSCFRLVAHAGAPCPDPVKRRLIETFPAGSTWEFYGSTEGQFTSCRSEEWLERPGTVGRARPGRTLRVDEDGPEVENTLAEHPGVIDVAVYGLPDETWGQRVVAAVVGTATPAQLDAWCRERLAPPKRPKEYVVLEELPRTLTGKVLRRNLAAGD